MPIVFHHQSKLLIENFFFHCEIFLIRIDNHKEKLNEIKEMIAVAKLEKMTILEQQVK
jgi:hypothetical protein